MILPIKIIHITAGCLALVSGLLAILLRKNVNKHRPMGKFYFWCMTTIFITSIPMAVYKFNLFLFFINIFTYHSTTTAYRSLKLKHLHEGQKPLTVDWLIEYTNILANLSLIIYGIYYSFAYEWQGGVIAFVFGSTGLNSSRLNLERLKGKIKHKNYWVIAHIGGMLGSYIGAITAFTVNNNRWIGMPDVVAWLGPTVILVPFILKQTSHFKRIELLRP